MGLGSVCCCAAAPCQVSQGGQARLQPFCHLRPSISPCRHPGSCLGTSLLLLGWGWGVAANLALVPAISWVQSGLNPSERALASGTVAGWDVASPQARLCCVPGGRLVFLPGFLGVRRADRACSLCLPSPAPCPWFSAPQWAKGLGMEMGGKGNSLGQGREQEHTGGTSGDETQLSFHPLQTPRGRLLPQSFSSVRDHHVPNPSVLPSSLLSCPCSHLQLFPPG